MLTEEERAINLRAKNLILKQEEYLQKEKKMEQKQKARKLMRFHITSILESFPFLGVVFIMAFVIGGVIFINVPEGVGCDRDNTLCRKLRLRQPKVIYQK